MLRRAIRCFALLSAGILIAGDLTQSQKQLNIDSFEHIWKKVRDTHWDPKLGGVNWQAAHDELRPAIEKADTMEQARQVMKDLLGRLHQTHFGIIPVYAYKEVDEQSALQGGDGSPGLDVRIVNGQVLVTSVDENSPAVRAGVRRGWQILRINGKDVASSVETITDVYRDSTLRDMMLVRALTSRLSGNIGEKVPVQFLDGAGKRVELAILESAPRGSLTRFGLLPPQHVWIESRRLDRNVGYIAFNMFLNPARLMPAFEDALKNFRDCRGVIIDIRGNPGGIGIMAMGMAGWFIEQQGRRLGTMLTRETPLQFVVNPRLPSYRGRLAILVDGSSASTSEIFAGGMQDLKRARVFGTRTAGAALPSFIEKLPNGDGFQCATANYVSESGKPLEGAGVIPDVQAPPSRELLLEDRDAAIESAIHWIHTP